jgi:5-methylthioadenosine/S-adenosylhomocysteine deaminase
MQKVDCLLVGGILLTMNEAFDLYEDGAVAIQGDSIVAVGAREDILRDYSAAETVDCTGQVIMPGLVNAHTHLAMSLLRGLADDLRLDVWLGYLMPTERVFVDEHFCYLGTKLAAAELIRSGTTCFADMYYYEEEVARAAAEVGIRGLAGQTVLKFPSPDSESFEAGLARAEKFIQEWKDHPLIVPSVAPHAPYTCTDEILKACADLAHEYDVPLIIHVSETTQEVADSRVEFGMPVVPRIKKLGVLDNKCLCAHCVHVDHGEIRTLHNYNVGVSHNPTSNLKLASGIAPIKEMLDQKVNVGIGTDGAASNNDLDMFTEIHLTAILAKSATNDPTTLPAKQALLMATRMGAAACHLDHLVGSLEVGKRADIIIVNLRTLHNTPYFRYNEDAVYAQMVYATKSTDVQHVVCNGQWLMRDRQLLTIDEGPLLEEAQAIAVKIDDFTRDYSTNIMSKLILVGSLQRQESFEIQLKTRMNDRAKLDALLYHPDIEIVKYTRYRQYDTYFLFDGDNARLRYREDDRLDENGDVASVRTRLTYTQPTKEREFDKAILLSQSQFYSVADRPLRFYEEYFAPNRELEIHKERHRWHINYKGVLFYVNYDIILHPEAKNQYFEIKSRTWSLKDAEYKASLANEIVTDILQVAETDRVGLEYVDLAIQ